jgi:hypothetical protein
VEQDPRAQPAQRPGGFQNDRGAVPDGNFLRDCKAQATAGHHRVAAPVKAVKHPSPLLDGNPRAGILDCQFGSGGCGFQADQQAAVPLRVLDRIVDEILDENRERLLVA